MDTHLDGQPGTFVRFSYLIATCASSGYGSSGHIATMAEAGYPGYPGNEDVRLTPAGTPKEIVVKIHDDVAKAFARLMLGGLTKNPQKKFGSVSLKEATSHVVLPNQLTASA
jgi:hypothetical protein